MPDQLKPGDKFRSTCQEKGDDWEVASVYRATYADGSIKTIIEADDGSLHFASDCVKVVYRGDICGACGGSGNYYWDRSVKCPNCDGTGEVQKRVEETAASKEPQPAAAECPKDWPLRADADAAEIKRLTDLLCTEAEGHRKAMEERDAKSARIAELEKWKRDRIRLSATDSTEAMIDRYHDIQRSLEKELGGETWTTPVEMSVWVMLNRLTKARERIAELERQIEDLRRVVA